MPLYERTQVGWVMTLAVLPGVVTGLLVSRMGVDFGWAVAAIALVLLLLFGALTVRLTTDGLLVRFGIGLLRRRIPIRDITACRPVRNPWYYGWGIRMIPGGVLYNVSGLSAVELTLANGRILRIGTDEPDALAAAIARQLPINAPVGPAAAPSGNVPIGVRVAVALLVLVVVGIAGTVVWSGPRPQRATPQIVRADIEQLIRASGAEAAVVWQPLDARPGEAIRINETMRFHAASTMKVPVMIELFGRVEAKQLRLSDTVPVTNQFHSIVDGSPYVLSASVDSDGDTYTAIGRPMTLSALCEAMITVSSNLAANVLIEKLGARAIQSTVDRIGASGMQVLRGVEDQKAFDHGINNTTDAAGLARLFALIGRGEAVSPGASAAMVEILKRQTFNDGIPAGVPPGTAVAHKTGTITAVHHDAGIVFARRPYVLVVLTRGLADEKRSAALIAAISRAVSPLGARQP